MPLTDAKTRRAILLLAWLGWVFDVADTALFNFAKAPMLTQMLGAEGYKRRGAQVEGAIQSIFLLGWALGGLVFGILAGRWGRTRTLVVTVLLYCLFTGLTALCRTPEQVACARFLSALGIGGEWAAGAALVAEAFSDASRPIAASWLQTAAAFGPMLAALANLGLAGRPWQWLFLVGIAPALLCAIARTGAHDPVTVAPKTKQPLTEIFSNAKWRGRAVAAMIVGAVGIAGAGTATFWQPNLVKAASEGLSKAVIDTRTSQLTMTSHLGTLAGVFVAPWLAARFGRKRTIGVFFVCAPLMALAAIGGGAAFGRLMELLPLVNFFAIGVSAVFVLYFPELFPTSVRATGSGLAYNVGRLLAIPMPLFTGWAIGRFGGSVAAGVVLSGTIYLVGLLAIPFLPETRGEPLLD